MPFGLKPHEQKILVDYHHLSGHLFASNPNMDTTREDDTTFEDEGWQSEGVLNKTATYQIEGYMENAPADTVQERLNNLMGDVQIVSVLQGNNAGDPVDMLKVRAASYATTPDPSSWVKVQMGFAPDAGGFAAGLSMIPLTDVAGDMAAHLTPVADLGKPHSKGGIFHFHLTDCKAAAAIKLDIRSHANKANAFDAATGLYDTGNPLAPAAGFSKPTALRFETSEAVNRYVRVNVTSAARPYTLCMAFAPHI